MDKFYAIFRGKTHVVFFAGGEGFDRVLDLTILGRETAVEILEELAIVTDALVLAGADPNAGSSVHVVPLANIPECFKPALNDIPLDTITIV